MRRLSVTRPTSVLRPTRMQPSDADPLVVGHADEQGQPTVEAWAKRYYYGITAFGDGGLALGLAASVVEVDPMRFKGVTEIGPRGEHSALTAADAEATDGIGRSLRDAFQLEFYHGFLFLVPIPINVTVLRCYIVTLHFLEFMSLIAFLSWQRLYPASLTPPLDNHPGSGIGDVILQREDVVGGEGVGEAVKDSAVLRVASGVVGIGGILLAEDIAKETALLLKDIFRHHQREVDDVLRLLLTREQTGHHTTAHTDHGGTSAVGVHHPVNALHGLLALVLDP